MLHTKTWNTGFICMCLVICSDNFSLRWRPMIFLKFIWAILWSLAWNVVYVKCEVCNLSSVYTMNWSQAPQLIALACSPAVLMKLFLPYISSWGRGNYLFSHTQVPWQVTMKAIHVSDCLHPFPNIQCHSCAYITHDLTYISPLLYYHLIDFFQDSWHPLKFSWIANFCKKEICNLFGLFLVFFPPCWNREPALEGCVSIRLCETGFKDIATWSLPIGLCCYSWYVTHSLPKSEPGEVTTG